MWSTTRLQSCSRFWDRAKSDLGASGGLVGAVVVVGVHGAAKEARLPKRQGVLWKLGMVSMQAGAGEVGEGVSGTAEGAGGLGCLRGWFSMMS